MTVASLTQPQSAPKLMVPAVPTDTCTILSNLLTLSRQARRDREECPESGIMPRNILMLLLRTMKLRDPTIVVHGQRIATIASGLAAQLGWDEQERRILEVAALLHDLGKIGVPEHILRKPGKLSSEEHDFVTHHHQASVSLLQALQADVSLISMLTCLDRNFDAAGVEKDESDGSRELPLGSRILAVADAYDSLSSSKAYRRGMSHKEVMSILRDHSGTRYDGNVVSTLQRWFDAEGHTLFAQSEPFSDYLAPDMTHEQRDEVVVVTQILHVLYQFQTLYNGYFIVDESKNYCIWSDGMPALTGRTVGNVLGHRWNKSDVHLSAITKSELSDDDSVDEIVSQVLRNGRTLFGSRTCRVSDSQKLTVDVHTIALKQPASPIAGVVQLFRSKRGVERRTREYAELKLAATRDALTGAANRGQLETQLRHLIDDFHNHEGANPLSVIFLDVDHFKGINDTFGHKAGDQVLVDLTRLLQNDTFSGEIIGRYGGEEFVVVCPDADLESAFRRAERLRLAIAKSSVGGISRLSVTSSFGIATTRLGDTVQTLFERADMCLLRAKEAGRNRTCREDDNPESGDDDSGTEGFDSAHVTIVDGCLRYSENIEVSTSLELTALKLNAFLDESDMKIKNQEQGFIRIQAGRSGFSRRWGDASERQPVSIEVQFETKRRVNAKARARRTIHFVNVMFQPIGRPADTAAFESRCAPLTQELRGYLLSSYGDVDLS